MNKRAARILILFLVFAASVGVFTHLMSHETTENATDLDAASLPVLYMKTADTTVNRMYGYRQEMNGVTTRENLPPLPMDRSLTLENDAKGQKIKNVTTHIREVTLSIICYNSYQIPPAGFSDTYERFSLHLRNTTVPFTNANNVWSFPIPTFSPG